MSRGKNVSSAAKCPFYIYETADKVVCEGIVEGTRLQVHFPEREAASRYRSKYCNDLHGCGKCEIAKVLTRKY